MTLYRQETSLTVRELIERLIPLDQEAKVLVMVGVPGEPNRALGGGLLTIQEEETDSGRVVFLGHP